MALAAHAGGKKTPGGAGTHTVQECFRHFDLTTFLFGDINGRRPRAMRVWMKRIFLLAVMGCYLAFAYLLYHRWLVTEAAYGLRPVAHIRAL